MTTANATADVTGYENVNYVIKKIPLSQIQNPEYALREAQVESPNFLELKDSIAKHGILLNLLVKEIGEDSYGLIDGLQRFTALKMLHPDGKVEVPCRVIEANEAQLAELQIIANGVRVETSPIQFTQQLRRILNSNPTLSKAQLAERLNMSVKWLEDRLNLDNLSDAAKSLVDEGKIRLTYAFTLSKLQPKSEQDEFLQQAITQSYAEFSGNIEARIKEIRTANRAGKTPGERQFVAVPQFRKLPELNEIVQSPQSTIINELIAVEAPATLADAVKLGIRYALQLDTKSVEAKRIRDQQMRAQKEAEKAAQRAQQAQLSAESALKKAQEISGKNVEDAA